MSTTIHDVLDRMRATAASNRELGDRFERLMKAYLTTDPQFVQQFSDVWLWSEWPDNDGKTDTGIDLVAKQRDATGYTAIQCKFYAPSHHMAKEDIDSFFTASGKSPFTSRIIISTTDRWGRNAEDALNRQQIPVSRIGLSEISQSPIDWDIAWPVAGAAFSLVLEPKKSLRPHQTDAVKAVLDGFTAFDRGKLIMACGTGKTFTSLKIAEQLVAAKEAGEQTSVLFLVPSISLLSQSLREWTAQSTTEMRTFAVCSDTKVGRHSTVEDISAHDLAFPATTDTGMLIRQMAEAGRHAPLTVIFSTYQSIGTVARAQQAGLPEFDLIVCDEAHRTTGVTLAGEDDSNFVRVHDQSYLQARKRLYMTATPRLFDDSTKSAAQEKSAVLASMDDERLFGPEFHRLGFGQAVEEGLLTDYKVLILTVDEKYIARSLQSQLADDNAEIRIDDAVKIVGCWNGLAKRSGTTADGGGFAPGEVPMRRAVAFSRSIAESKKLTDRFTQVIDGYDDANEELLRCEVQHVDGTYNALLRNQKLDWLKAEIGENECRILSNARCLSEGVDVPGLDAVLFLNPRNSVVDVVQSVGRVMRKAEGKDYGYIILPVGIPADTPPEQALADNKRYKVVWQVLQALRAHDDRFNATVNKIDLNKNKPKQIMVGTVGFDDDGAGSSSEQSSAASAQLALDLHVQEWRDAIYAKIVQKVGERAYWENWAKDVAAIAARHTARIIALLDGPASEATEAFENFLQGLRNNLNDSISRDDAVDMLSQHLITRPVFEALFEDYSFTQHNPVSQVMQRMLDVLDKHHVDNEADSLEGFYASVRTSVADIDNIRGKQRIITELYERFFKIAFPRAAESLGIVYTPVEVVDFIIRAVESTLRSEFGASISDSGVHVLDPFTGTGTFIVRLLQSGLIRTEDLLHKYTQELHANEILLLAYYIAAINIEASYHAIAGGEYQPFNGIVLTDTFQISEDGDSMDEVMFPQNNERVAHQKSQDIKVIMGNPPYSAGQNSQNDANQNQKYPTLDAAIARTYAARSTATNKNSLYDSYIRAIRWATDRIGDEGIICYVSNGGYIDGNTADGLRKTLADEFSSIYCYNLRGNQRTAGELSRREGGKIFGQGSRNTVAVLLLVKNPAAEPGCKIYYRDIGDYLTREQKLAIVAEDDLDSINWQPVVPNPEGDWISQRGTAFGVFTPIGDKSGTKTTTIFESYSAGLKSNRDAWVYNYSKAAVASNVARMIDFYNSQVADLAAYRLKHPTADEATAVAKVLDLDPSKISWNRGTRNDLLRETPYEYDQSMIREALYRPFCKQSVYFDRQLNDMVYQLPRLFPRVDAINIGIVLTGVSSHFEFTPFISDRLPDLHLLDTGQYFPRYRYEAASTEADLFSEPDGEASFDRIDNITDAILADYQKSFGSPVTKDDIFYYVYGILHSPEYRQAFAADLKKSLPRIPKVSHFEAFQAFAQGGRDLAALHVGYENVEPYPLTEQTQGDAGDPDFYRVQKMAFGKAAGSAKDRSRIVYNSRITVIGIPEEAYRYQLGSRSAIEWIMDRYQVRTDKASGIVNDPNDWAAEHGEPRYILDLLKRIVTVSIETMKIVDGLPSMINLVSEGGLEPPRP